MKKYITAILLCFLSLLSGAQVVLVADGPEATDNYRKRLPSYLAAQKEIQEHYLRLISSGYLDARIDTSSQDSLLFAHILPGPVYRISGMDLVHDSLSPTPIVEYRKKHRPAFTQQQIQSEADKLLAEYENRGFPFASFVITSYTWEEQFAHLLYRLDPGPRIVMDSVAIKSESKIPYRYVKSYLDIRKGDLYNEEKLNRIPVRLREIPFLTVRQKPELVFHPGEADLFLFLEKKKANFFNGILGVRPDDKTGKVNITGDAEIKLVNAFNGGEEFYLNWRKMQALTQDLTVKTNLPYLFSTPIGIDGLLKIYKRDTTFTSTKTNIGLVFNFSGVNRLKLFAEKNTTAQVSSFITAQPLANVNSTLYGLAFSFEHLDYRYNPRSGFAMQAEAASGKRQVQSNNLITENPTEIKDKHIYRCEVNAEYFLPTWKQQCIRIAANGAALIAPSLFENEMYRIGGLRTLRGIDEESINASSWLTGTLEYRLLFGENSAVYLFADQAWYEQKSALAYLKDTPLGFGAGVNFETNAGIFTFNYALGQQFSNPLLVRNAKISFGFRNLF